MLAFIDRQWPGFQDPASQARSLLSYLVATKTIEIMAM
jgi:hypothetical protein